MEQRTVRDLLAAVAQGEITPEQAETQLRIQPFIDLGYAKLDTQRKRRQGTSEVIYGKSKTPAQICGIVTEMLHRGEQDILVTHLSALAAEQVRALAPLDWDELSELGIVNPNPNRPARGNIVVASGGTSDMPVCEEAARTAEALGNRVTRLYDVGVAGLHRLMANLDVLAQARVVIAVAGPVIAVPTSVGYGANFGGLSALLSMLNSCASGVSVVNIDNGFGAGFLASRINQMEGLV